MCLFGAGQFLSLDGKEQTGNSVKRLIFCFTEVKVMILKQEEGK